MQMQVSTDHGIVFVKRQEVHSVVSQEDMRVVLKQKQMLDLSTFF